MNAVSDEVERGASLHHLRLPRMMREHEGRHVIGRLVAPPALPAVIRPRAANGSEHVPPQNPRPDVVEATLGELVVDALLAFTHSLHRAPDVRADEPFHDVEAIDAEWILEILARTGAVAVEGNAEVSAKSGHCTGQRVIENNLGMCTDRGK